MSITNILQLLVSGVAMGAIYTLTAKGLFITHLATGKLNFGQGDFLMVGAFLTIGLLVSGISPLLAIVAVLAGMAILGYLLERIAVRPLDRAGDQTGGYAWVLTTAATALILQNVVELIWGKSAQYSPPIFSSKRDDVIELFGVGIFAEEVAIIALAFGIVIAFYIFLFK